jgi:enterochelin esterase-like enzyme
MIPAGRKMLTPATAAVLLSAACAAAPAAPPTATLPAVCADPGTVVERSLPLGNGIAYPYRLYLPPCYDPRADAVYPVLYLIPGRSSNHSTWFDAGAAELADRMIHERAVPPFLIVATNDTDNDLQAETIRNRLIPFVEENHRIDPLRRMHAVAGGSLGGVAAYRVGFGDPARFASVGIFGNGATDGEEDRIRGWLAGLPAETAPRVFLNVGYSDEYMLGRANVMIGILDAYSIPHTEIFTAGDHSYSYWMKQMPDFYRWLAEAWR